MRTMKDSEIGWIGQIPKNWLIKQAKFVLDIYTGATPKSQVPEYWDGDILWVTPADYKTEDVYITDTKKHITQSGYESCSTTIVPRGSLIFSKRAPIGTVAIADKDLCTNQGCLACVCNNNALYKYIYYQMQSLSEIFNSLGEGTTFLEISYSSFRSVKFVLPSLSEQQAIADYLDDKCAKIDTTIAKRKAIIEKLKEYKSAVITKVVTKGLNPDAEMKDSGIDWIGKIPKHWEYKRLKFLLKTNVNDLKIGPFGSALKGKTLPKDKGEYCIYAQANLIENTFEVTKHYVDAETFSELNSYEIYPDDMLFSMMGTIGKCKAMPHGFTKGIMDSHLLKARFSEEQIYAPYFEYFYDKDNSYAAILQLNKMAVGSIMSGLNCNILKNVMITVPPMNEQMAIVAYLDSQCAKIDEAIEKQEQAVAKLEEYRKSVIYYAVTGKIDCRDKESIA